jgi:hypothetical protein
MFKWARCGSHKKRVGTYYAELAFLHPVWSRVWNVDALFFMLGWAWCGSHKKCDRARYGEVAFLHPVWSTCHVVHSGVSGHEMSSHYFSCSGGTSPEPTRSATGQVTLNLHFCFRCNLRLTSCVRVRLGREILTNYFSCSGGLVACWGHQYFSYSHSFSWDTWPYHTITSTTIKSSGKLVLMLLRI